MDKVITRQANDGNLYHSVMNEKGRYVTLEEYRNSNLEDLTSEQGTKMQLTEESWDKRLDAMNKAWQKNVEPLQKPEN